MCRFADRVMDAAANRQDSAGNRWPCRDCPLCSAAGADCSEDELPPNLVPF